MSTITQPVDPCPTETIPVPDKGVVSGLTTMGSMVFSSVRCDYADTMHERTDYIAGDRLTRLEYAEHKIQFCDGVISLTGLLHCVRSIKLVDMPFGLYTLNVDGVNVMSTTNQVFDIEHTENNALNALRIRTSQGGPCMCGECHNEPDGARCNTLDLGAFDDVRICYNKKQVIPDIVTLILDTHRGPQTVQIRTRFYIIPASSPTEHITVKYESIGDAQMELRMGSQALFTGTVSGQGILVFRFSGEFNVDGVEDLYMKGHGLRTCNLTRMPKLRIYLDGGKVTGLYSGYYMTYIMPNGGYGNHVLSPFINPDGKWQP